LSPSWRAAARIGSTIWTVDARAGSIDDVTLPKMDGSTSIRSVRETHPDMKAIFISGYTEDSFRQRRSGSCLPRIEAP
jgi:CheY-like chemotaxis protein